MLITKIAAELNATWLVVLVTVDFSEKTLLQVLVAKQPMSDCQYVDSIRTLNDRKNSLDNSNRRLMNNELSSWNLSVLSAALVRVICNPSR